jgi:hypothetical protein
VKWLRRRHIARKLVVVTEDAQLVVQGYSEKDTLRIYEAWLHARARVTRW